MSIFDWFRKPSVQNSITASAELWDALLGGHQTLSGVTMTPEKAVTIAAADAAVGLLSETLAQLPLSIFMKDGDKVVEAQDHPSYRPIVLRPTGYLNGFEFRELMQVYLLLWGNCYAYKNKVGNKIYELAPIHPSRVEVKQNPKTYEVTYKVQLDDNEAIVLNQSQVFHIKDRTFNGYLGQSRIHRLREALGLTLRTQDFASMLFGNGARPSGILSTAEKLSAEQMKKIGESWKASHGGDKQMGTAVLDAGFKWQTISFNASETQLTEARKFQVIEVARIFRVPPHMLMDLERATFSNIEHQDISFVKYSMTPWTTRWEQAINTQLLSEDRTSKYFARFDMDALLRGDTKSRAAYYASMVQNKILNRNEIRKKEGYNPVEGGDEFENPAITPGGAQNEDQDPSKNDQPQE